MFQHIGEAGQSDYPPGGRIKQRLKREEARFRKAYKKRVAVINSGADKGMDYYRRKTEEETEPPLPWISCLVSHIISCNTIMDSAFISEQSGIFSCTLCECTSKLHNV